LSVGVVYDDDNRDNQPDEPTIGSDNRVAERS
jgi:hypothetical protein